MDHQLPAAARLFRLERETARPSGLSPHPTPAEDDANVARRQQEDEAVELRDAWFGFGDD